MNFVPQFLLVFFFAVNYNVSSRSIHCRDPGLGSHNTPRMRANEKKFLVMGGVGAGIGNFLIFYPAAYYFAVLSGRDIIIADDSLIAEMCNVLYCGFPFVSQVASAFPLLINREKLNKIRGAKTWDFHRHMRGEILLDDTLIRADGYKYMSGWYLDYNQTQTCISHLTGCKPDDVSCHDRYALQKLVRGPFRSKFTEEEESKLIGVPANFKHGIMTLPHSYAPRLDASIHLRVQFKHFEYLIGPEDTALWPAAMKEQENWLNSKDSNAGEGLYRAVEEKIMSELPRIKAERVNSAARRRQLVSQYWTTLLGQQRHLSNVNTTQVELDNEQSVFSGDSENDDKVYIYLASDNERVKSAMAEYLLGHKHIALMRVRSDHLIVHAKNLEYLKRNTTGVMNLVLDWYCMSLSNIVFAWRRDTHLLSTFAQSAARVSGNGDTIDRNFYGEESSQSSNSNSRSDASGEPQRARGFQLTFKNGRAAWSEF